MNDQSALPQDGDQEQILQWLEMREALQHCLIRFAHIQEIQELSIAEQQANKEAVLSR